MQGEDLDCGMGRILFLCRRDDPNLSINIETELNTGRILEV